MAKQKIDMQAKRVLAEKERMIKKYGAGAAAIASEKTTYNVIPTVSRALNYALGTGGIVRGTCTEVYGRYGIGKSTIMLAGTLRNAQRMGLLGGIIAMEPNINGQWLEDNGIDPEKVIIGYPDHGEHAFEMLYDWVFSGILGFIGFDSIGAVVSEGETQADGKKKAYGASGLITWGLNRVMPRVYKNNIALMLVNQQRDDTKNANPNIKGLVESPGGHALKHHARTRIQLKPGKDRFVIREEGEELMVGQQIVASIKKNSLAEGTANSAQFRFFHVHTDQYPFGVDETEDLINTAKRAGVIEGSTWLYHETFPGGKVQGKDKLAAFLAENPDSLKQIDTELNTRMMEVQEERRKKREKNRETAKVVEITAPEDDDDDSNG